MRKVSIDHAMPGARIAKAIFTSEGRVLLTSGMVLKENFRDKIKSFGIRDIYIEDTTREGIGVKDIILESTRLEAKTIVKNLMNRYSLSQTLNTRRAAYVVGKVIEELLDNRDILSNLADIKSVDDYTFEHSVNVCILSLITGIGLGFNLSRLKDLGVGALLHDIGKLRVPGEILKKPSQLTMEEFEEIKRHTVYGYEILRDCSDISMISAFIALGHHERYDGSGYPLLLRGENIHLCARIVAVADVYDALTSDRVYKRRLRPHEVIEYITSLGSHHFDKEIVKSFIHYISIYPEGTGVILNTMERGIVVKVNKSMPTRPVVRVVYDKNNKPLKGYYVVNLARNLDLHIADCCEV